MHLFYICSDDNTDALCFFEMTKPTVAALDKNGNSLEYYRFIFTSAPCDFAWLQQEGIIDLGPDQSVDKNEDEKEDESSNEPTRDHTKKQVKKPIKPHGEFQCDFYVKDIKVLTKTGRIRSLSTVSNDELKAKSKASRPRRKYFSI